MLLYFYFTTLLNINFLTISQAISVIVKQASQAYNAVSKANESIVWIECVVEYLIFIFQTSCFNVKYFFSNVIFLTNHMDRMKRAKQSDASECSIFFWIFWDRASFFLRFSQIFLNFLKRMLLFLNEIAWNITFLNQIHLKLGQIRSI